MNEFFANIYELWYLDDFSTDMYNYNIYLSIGLTLIISCPLLILIYYKVIDHPHFSRLKHWLLYVLIIVLFNFGFAWFWASSEIDIIYDGQQTFTFESYLSFSLLNGIYAFVLSFLISIPMKKISNNCSTTPF